MFHVFYCIVVSYSLFMSFELQKTRWNILKKTFY